MSSTLAEIVRELRAVTGESLRAVENATGISNAYLSQIESGAAKKPSPDKLYALAKHYGVPYRDLMRAAGHVQHGAADTGRLPNKFELALMSMNLTPSEEDQVLRYVNRVLRD